MVLLTLLVTFRLLFIGSYLVATKKVHIKQFRNMDGEFPKYALSARDHFRNMFEIPILFYLLCILLIIKNEYDSIDIYLAAALFSSLTEPTVSRKLSRCNRDAHLFAA